MRTTIPNTNIENTDSRNTVLPEGEYLNRNITITLIIGLVWSILLWQTVPKITFGDTELTQLVYSSTFLIAQGLISAYLTYLSIKYYTKKNTKYLIFNKNIYKNLLIVIVVILLLGVILGISIGLSSLIKTYIPGGNFILIIIGAILYTCLISSYIPWVITTGVISIVCLKKVGAYLFFTPLIVIIVLICIFFYRLGGMGGHGRPFRSRRFFGRSKEANIVKGGKWSTIKK